MVFMSGCQPLFYVKNQLVCAAGLDCHINETVAGGSVSVSVCSRGGPNLKGGMEAFVYHKQ